MTRTHSGRWRRFGGAIAALALAAGTVLIAAPSAAAEAAWSTDVTVTSADAETGLTVEVSGTNYDNLPNATGSSVGIYVALYDASTTDWSDINQRQYLAVDFLYGNAADWATELDSEASEITATSDLRVITWRAHGDLTDDTVIADIPVNLTNEQLTALGVELPDGSDDESELPEESTDSPATAVKSTVSSDSKTLKIAATGKNYPAGGAYAMVYDASSTSYDDINTKLTDAGLGFAMVAPDDGSWSANFTVPAEKITAKSELYLVVWKQHSLISDDTLLDDVPIALTAEQLAAITGANTGTEEPPSSSSATPPSSSDKPTPRPTSDKPAPKPTATVAHSTLDVATGKNQTITASGFEPGETVVATLHSKTVQLGEFTADAQGAVTVDFKIPEGFELGEHSVVLEGQQSGRTATVTFTLTDSRNDIICTEEVVSATAGTPRLEWGVKGSFVSYVQSSIANGTVTTGGGAAKVGSVFTWGAGAGTLNGSGAGTVSFPGSVTFTGHDGILHATLSNLKVQITGPSSAKLVLDAASSDMSGKDVSGTNIDFATLTFSSLGATGGTASATLTAAGATAFAGFYEAGESLDSLTVSFTGATAEHTVERCYDADGNLIEDESATNALAQTGVATGTLAGTAGLLLAAGVLLIVVYRRREFSMTH